MTDNLKKPMSVFLLMGVLVLLAVAPLQAAETTDFAPADVLTLAKEYATTTAPEPLQHTNFDVTPEADDSMPSDVQAQFSWGVKLINIGNNPAKAGEGMGWIIRSAKAGCAEAQFFMGRLSEKDGTNALVWYRLAADQGHPLAQAKLGDLYRMGKLVPQDFTQSVHWYREAADQKDIYAAYALGTLYENGVGVKVNPLMAAEWYRRALQETPGFAAATYFKNGTDWPHKFPWAAAWSRAAMQEVTRNFDPLYNPNPDTNTTYAQAQNADNEFTPAPVATYTYPNTTSEGQAPTVPTYAQQQQQPQQTQPAPPTVFTNAVTGQTYVQMEPDSAPSQSGGWAATLAQMRIEHATGVSLEAAYGRGLPLGISPGERSFLLVSLFFDDCDEVQRHYDAAQWRLKAAARDGGKEMRDVLVREVLAEGKGDSIELADRIMSLSASVTALASNIGTPNTDIPNAAAASFPGSKPGKDTVLIKSSH